ncbi:hypothetical protein OAC40_00110 [bacterium]|nr:hypothetical protein [bacterium]
MSAIEQAPFRKADDGALKLLIAIFAATGAACVIAAVYFTLPIVQASLLAAAFVCSFGTLKNLAQLIGQKRLIVSAQNTFNDLVTNDPGYAFLTDASGEVLICSRNAKQRFDVTGETNLAVLLTAVIANPDVVLFRILSQASELGGSKEDVITRTGHFRLSATSVDEETFIWRLEEASIGDTSASKVGQGKSIPMLTYGARGAVLFVNEACRSFLGFRPKSLTEIFGDVPPRTAHSYEIKAADGVSSVTIAIIESNAGRQEMFLIPMSASAADNSGPRELIAEWDAIEDLPVPLLKISSAGEVLASNREARTLLDLASTEVVLLFRTGLRLV